MKTYFHIENKEFTDYLKVTIQEKEYYFCDDLTIEYDECDTLNVDIELIKAEEYLKINAKNAFMRVLLNVVKWILAPLVYFFDNEDGIGLDKGYFSFNPFTIKQSISIDAPDEMTISITCIESSYNKTTKKFTPPTLIHQEHTIITTEEILFTPLVLKRDWRAYHIPAFSVITVVILLLNWLNFSIFAKVIREIPTSQNLIGIVGMSVCSIVLIALLVAHAVVTVKAYKLYKKVLKENM